MGSGLQGHGHLDSSQDSHPRRGRWRMRRHAPAFQAPRLPYAPAGRGLRVQALAALRLRPSVHTQPQACRCIRKCCGMF